MFKRVWRLCFLIHLTFLFVENSHALRWCFISTGKKFHELSIWDFIYFYRTQSQIDWKFYFLQVSSVCRSSQFMVCFYFTNVSIFVSEMFSNICLVFSDESASCSRNLFLSMLINTIYSWGSRLIIQTETVYTLWGIKYSIKSVQFDVLSQPIDITSNFISTWCLE